MATLREQILDDCANKSLECLGTSYIFQKKAEWLERLVRINSLLGIIVPALVGAGVGIYGTNSSITKIMLLIASPFGISQVALSVYSLVNKWDGGLSYGIESQSANQVLSEEFQKIIKYPPTTDTELDKQFSVLIERDRERCKQDNKVTFSGKEERKGYRYARFHLHAICAICKQVPQSMSPSNCATCGNF